ncbi:restriction endonuclease subunit S [Helicobacter pylori]|nr:restriction endonuclease subunit S [Helicobacter pylori]
MDALTTPSNWQRVRLGDILTLKHGRDYKNFKLGNIPVYGSGGYMLSINNFLHNGESVCIGRKGTIDKPIYLNGKFWVVDTLFYSYSFKKSIPKFIFYAFSIIKWSNYNEATGIPSLTKMTISNIEIPLPPLNEQIAIANILSDVDRYLYSLDALILKKESVKKALSFELLSQRKRLKGFNQAWQRVRLGDMTTSFTKQTGFDYSASIKPTLIKEQLPHYIPFIQNKDFSGHYINYKTDYFIPNEIAIRFPQILLNEKCLLISIVGSIGNVAVFNHSQDAFTGCAIAVLKFKEKKSLDFVMHFLMSASGQKSLLNIVKASSHKSIILADLRDLLIPLPPLNEQIAIANILSGLDHEIISFKNKKRQFENIKKALNHDLMSAKIRVLKIINAPKVKDKPTPQGNP